MYGARQNLQFAQGRAFENYSVGKPAGVLFEAVLGAEVAKRLKHKVGDKIALSHGMQIQQTEPSHADKPFTVVGVLQPTGTPVDPTESFINDCSVSFGPPLDVESAGERTRQEEYGPA